MSARRDSARDGAVPRGAAAVRTAAIALAILALAALRPGISAAGDPAAGDAAGPAAAAADTGGSAAGASDPEPEIRDPLFAFFIAMTDADSLGVWGADDLRAFMDAVGRSSQLPFDHIVRIERRAARPGEIEKLRGRKITRIWDVALDQDLEVSMPYSILGYHPGRLLISQELGLSEWDLGDPNFHVARDDQVTVYPSTGLIAFRVDSGYVVLDVDGWLDRLLGGKLDDAWTRGFAVCRVEGRLYGIAVGANKKGRDDYGEFDFAKDKVLPHGRPVARGMNYYVKPWLRPAHGAPDRVWTAKLP